MSIKDRAVLVKFTDRCWVAGTVDRKASDEVEESNDAQKGTGRYWKRLVPKIALKERSNIGSEARGFHDAQTLPWLGGGIRILPAANFADYMKGMRERQAKAETAVKKFTGEYRDWVAEAKRTQGRLFNEADYPSEAALAQKFGFEVDVLPLPNISDWRVELSAEQVSEIRKEAEQRMADVQREGIAELFERMKEVVQRAKDKLGDPEAIFRDSLVGNIKEMSELVGKLNITGDAGLEKVRVEVESKLAKLSPNVLRVDPVQRSKAAKDAGSIINRMSAFMGGAAVPMPEPRKQIKKKAPAKKARK